MTYTTAVNTEQLAKGNDNMNKSKHTNPLRGEHDLSKAIAIRRKQIAFDKYPKGLQELLTRMGLNPYETHIDDMVEYREFTPTIAERK